MKCHDVHGLLSRESVLLSLMSFQYKAVALAPKCDRERAAAVSHITYQNGTQAAHPGLHLILQLSYKRLSDKNFLSTCMSVRWACTGLLPSGQLPGESFLQS